MRPVAIAVCLAACGGGKSAPKVSVKLPDITLVGRVEVADAIAIVDGKQVHIDLSNALGTPDKPNDPTAEGVLVPRSGAWDANAGVIASGTIGVLADKDAHADTVLAAIANLSHSCLAFLGHDGTRLTMLREAPCPAAGTRNPALVVVDDPETPVLIVYSDGAKVRLETTRINEIVEPVELDSALADQKKSVFFADRTDIEIAVADGTSYGEVVRLMDHAIKAGFTSPRWIAAGDVPADLAGKKPPGP